MTEILYSSTHYALGGGGGKRGGQAWFVSIWLCRFLLFALFESLRELDFCSSLFVAVTVAEVLTLLSLATLMFVDEDFAIHFLIAWYQHSK